MSKTTMGWALGAVLAAGLTAPVWAQADKKASPAEDKPAGQKELEEDEKEIQERFEKVLRQKPPRESREENEEETPEVRRKPEPAKKIDPKEAARLEKQRRKEEAEQAAREEKEEKQRQKEEAERAARKAKEDKQRQKEEAAKREQEEKDAQAVYKARLTADRLEIARYEKAHEYCGKDSVPFAGNQVQAENDALDKARVQLSKSIETTVEQGIKDEMGQSAGSDYQKIDVVTKFYTKRIMGRPDVSKVFPSYPDENNFTAVMCASKATVDEWLKKELQTKLAPVIQNLNDASAMINKSQFSAALTKLLSTREAIENPKDAQGGLFRLPIGLIKKPDGRFAPVSQGAHGEKVDSALDYVGSRIAELVSGVSLEVLDDNIPFSAEGRVNRNPRVRASYVDDKGVRTPLASLSLTTSWSSGSGHVASGARTGESGICTITVRDVDASTPEAILDVSLDKNALGIRSDDAAQKTVPVKFVKARTAALAVLFKGGGSTEEFRRRLRPDLVKNGFDVVELSGVGSISEAVRSARDGKKADGLLYVALEAGASGPDDADDYYATATGEARMLELPQETVSFAVACDCAGAGAKALSAASAKAKAFGVCSQKCLKQITDELQGLRR